MNLLNRLRRRILIVADRQSPFPGPLEQLSANYDVVLAHDAATALVQCAATMPDVILLHHDSKISERSGLCRKLRLVAARHRVQIILVGPSGRSRDLMNLAGSGADDYISWPVDLFDLESRIALHVRLLTSETQVKSLPREAGRPHNDVQDLADEGALAVVSLQDLAVFTLAKVAESRDNETGQHVFRLREYAQLIATELAHSSPYSDQITDDFLADLYRSSPLHDIGKVGIPDDILLKPGPLTLEERELMQRHTTIGANILHQAIVHWRDGGFLALAASIARFHHEKWDGSGYPAGLVGTEIPLANRIVAVADVYDALTSARPYKPAWPSDQAKATIEAGAGTQFDPVVVEAFDRVFPKVLEIQRQKADCQQLATGAMAFHGLELALAH